ncbi:hypothetical protein [Paenisporosarcina sp. NPDC076907]|uniref:hypothetical protein n=1 Tax=Paenisporosarcina sp. NPDC076907 TaxID=3390604 RepID=UPI003CFE679D
MVKEVMNSNLVGCFGEFVGQYDNFVGQTAILVGQHSFLLEMGEVPLEREGGG